jgi:hypothetical protein
MIVLILFLVCAFCLLRSALVVTGMYKAPILHSFEKYGGEEDFYYPVIYLAVWLFAFLIVLAFLLYQARFPRVLRDQFFVYIIFAPVGLIAWRVYALMAKYAKEHPELFLVYPHWYTNVRERTSRAERRRLAYMWLHLPWRTRLLYNSSDQAFLIWVDLVILATLRPEADAPKEDTDIYTYNY